MQWVDHDRLKRVIVDKDTHAGLLAMVPGLLQELEQVAEQPARPIPDEALRHTLGARE
jgi:hypothetical protein